MYRRSATLALAAILLLAPVWAAAQDTLTAAYDAILRGDFDTGQAIIGRLLDTGGTPAEKAAQWIDSYRTVIASRSELKQKTLDWNIEQAKQALTDGQTYLALSFTAQAAAYADDKAAFIKTDWIPALTDASLKAAEQLQKDGHWTQAASYYALLERIHEKADKETREKLKSLRQDATRNARVALLYKDPNALAERTEGVDRDIFRNAIRIIERRYFEEPNFKKSTLGGLDNLMAVARSEKLRTYLDGLANSKAREHFVSRLTALRNEVAGAETMSYKDVFRVFTQVVDANKVSVELPEPLLVVEFLDGSDAELDDYTSIIWPADAPDFDKMMMGGFQGVGIQLGLDERTSRLKVVTPLEDSPALEAGIQPDDLIVAVNGESTKGWTTEDAVNRIMGKAGTEVVLTMLRPRTGQELNFKLTRRTIELTSVRGLERVKGDSSRWNFIADPENGIAYIKLTNFQPKTQDELARALQLADEQGMKSLILDVRHNPGGLLDAVVEVVSNFIERGEIVSTRGRTDTDSRQRTGPRPKFRDLPLVVLTNDVSASASEILAGALKDHARAIVIGERTFGKGSVQHVQAITDATRLKLTTALYYLPSGRSPHRLPDSETWGVEPDVKVELTPKEFRRIIERERESYVIHNERPEGDNKVLTDEEREKMLATLKSDDKDEDDGPTLLSDEDIKKLDADPFEAPRTDPQLETALLMLRLKLAVNQPWPQTFASAEKAAPAAP
jgi:carboxyl-terminal processing protease